MAGAAPNRTWRNPALWSTCSIPFPGNAWPKAGAIHRRGPEEVGAGAGFDQVRGLEVLHPRVAELVDPQHPGRTSATPLSPPVGRVTSTTRVWATPMVSISRPRRSSRRSRAATKPASAAAPSPVASTVSRSAPRASWRMPSPQTAGASAVDRPPSKIPLLPAVSVTVSHSSSRAQWVERSRTCSWSARVGLRAGSKSIRRRRRSSPSSGEVVGLPDASRKRAGRPRCLGWDAAGTLPKDSASGNGGSRRCRPD